MNYLSHALHYHFDKWKARRRALKQGWIIKASFWAKVRAWLTLDYWRYLNIRSHYAVRAYANAGFAMRAGEIPDLLGWIPPEERPKPSIDALSVDSNNCRYWDK